MTNIIPVKLASPFVDERLEREVVAVLRSKRLVAGPKVEEFEQRLQQLTGRKHAIAVSSGTAALYIAMEALEVGKGSSVVVPALTFPAPAMAAAKHGADVKLCDVEKNSFNISEESLLAVMDNETTLVVGVDQFGAPCPAHELEKICKQNGIPLLIDAACSVGAVLEEKPCGSYGDVSIFSFHPRKIITTGEGGAVLTDDDGLALKMRRFRNIGIQNGSFESVGLNFRLSEIAAVMGIVQLDKLDEIIEQRCQRVKGYFSLPLSFQQEIKNGKTNYQTVAAVLDKKYSSGTRDNLVKFLAENGVEANIASYSIGRLEYFRQEFGFIPEDTPVADSIHDSGIALPMYYGIESEQIDYITKLVKVFFEKEQI